ncbi:MAG: F0F1 ATP synthase subunit gamma [Gammaproteobacteria bacterium]|nr:F0F1 ATP synthase subunit gamma [Gammaproteobacteria bacterium]
MTRRRDIEKHRRSLNEIREIMSAMKNLSYMEMHKISNFIDAQQAVVKNIETAAADFLSFNPEALTETNNIAIDAYLLIGTERGFCGDFNHALLSYFNELKKSSHNKKFLIVIGHKLATLFQEKKEAPTFIDGASVVEEAGKVLIHIVDQVKAIQEQHGLLNLHVLHHVYHDNKRQIVNRQLLPSLQNLLHQKSSQPHPPELNLEPREFLLELSFHHLFAALHEILYASLLAENRQRLAHLEKNIQRMDEQSEELHRQENVLRQEEIIEEIEVILLSAISFDEQNFN